MALGPWVASLAIVTAVATAGCGAAAIGVGVAVAGVGAAALASSCDESVSVTVFDGSARGICTAEVTAEAEGRRVVFSPCYAAYLGSGSWTVTARQGWRAVSGTVIVDENRRCGEPGVHTLELSFPSADAAPVFGPPSAPPPVPTTPAVAPSAPAVPTTAPPVEAPPVPSVPPAGSGP